MALLPPLRDSLALPLVAAPMFIVSNPELVVAQCKAGIVGSFPALNARPAAELETWLQRITSELAAYDEAHPGAPAAPLPSTRSCTAPMIACSTIWSCA